MLDCFKAILLLASSSPYQLTPDDLDTLQLHIHTWINHCQLRPEVAEDDVFVIDFHQATAPIYQSIFSGAITQAHLFGFNTQQLCEHLQQQKLQLQQQLDDNHVACTHKMSVFLCEHLLRAWHSLPSRRLIRHESCGQLNANIGLINTFHTLQEDSSQKHHQWNLINSSDDGYCLFTSDDYPEELRAGKIISLQENTESNRYWQIGIVRWVRYTHDFKLQIGIQLIAANAQAIDIQKLSSENGLNPHLHGLLLSESKAFPEPQSLVVPKLPFRAGQVVRISNATIDEDVLLTKSLQYSHYFNRFTYQSVADDEHDKNHQDLDFHS